MNNVETVTSNCGNEEWTATPDKWSADGSGMSANQLYSKYKEWHTRTKQSGKLKDFKVWLEDSIKTGLLKKTDKGYFAASGMKHGGNRHAPSTAQQGASKFTMGAAGNKEIVYCAGMRLRKSADGHMSADAATSPAPEKKKAGFMDAIKKHKVIILTGVGVAIAAVVIFKVVKAHQKKS